MAEGHTCIAALLPIAELFPYFLTEAKCFSRVISDLTGLSKEKLGFSRAEGSLSAALLRKRTNSVMLTKKRRAKLGFSRAFGS